MYMYFGNQTSVINLDLTWKQSFLILSFHLKLKLVKHKLDRKNLQRIFLNMLQNFPELSILTRGKKNKSKASLCYQCLCLGLPVFTFQQMKAERREIPHTDIKQGRPLMMYMLFHKLEISEMIFQIKFTHHNKMSQDVNSI